MKRPTTVLLVVIGLLVSPVSLAAVTCSGSLELVTPSGIGSPRSEPLAANQTMQLTTSGISCTGGTPVYSWTTFGFLGSESGPSGDVVSVSQSGLVTGLVEGYAFVRATETNSGLWGEATFSVTAAATAAQRAEFDAATGILSILEVSVSGQIYRNARLQLESGLNFRLLGIDEPATADTASTTAAQRAEFDAATGILSIPEVAVSGQIYSNARLQLESGLTFRLLSIDEPTVTGQCSESNINFTRYGSLPAWYTTVTEAGLNELIGCTGTLTSQNTTGTMRWSLPSSTEVCPRFLEVDLGKDNAGGWYNYGQSIRGINSDTNQPYAC